MGNEKITQRRKRAMITIKEWMELVDYKITEGSDYGWGCYGSNSFTLDSWNGVHGKGGYSFSIVFSTKSQKVYEVSMCDYTNDRAYRMINPKFQKKHAKEAEMRNVNLNEAWDSVDYVDLDVLDDFIQKALAIRSGEDYDTRVQVPVDFSDEELLQYMKMAHERDMTFNEFVEEALRHALEEVKAGRLTKEDAQRFVLERETVWPFETEKEDNED
jgi:ribosomal protein S18